ncbi:hypothetical protein [uncultured Roseibium sp.]|uniref:hypothetical protein n=1 Tax=uncultured Roseibium sp. TaxID=1936171 RepID=UPI00261123CC|nr:hypothetical protein [uncultured Roseibium sp.]
MSEKTKEQKLLEHVEKFIDDQKITCEETIYQTDWVIENAYKFIADCCEIVGYAELDED